MKTNTTTSEYGIIRKPLVATRMNEEETSSDTSFSSFLKSKDLWTTEWKTMICARNTMNTLYIQSFSVFQTCYFNFINLFIFPIKELFNFSNYGRNIISFVNNMSAREKTLWYPSLTDSVRPFSVERWKGRVVWGKRWLEQLFFSRQSRHSVFDVLIL